MTLKEVSDKLGEAGRPLLPSGISKIEEGERRIDVDDLLAFAAIFEVTPTELLGHIYDGTSEEPPVLRCSICLYLGATENTEGSPIGEADTIINGNAVCIGHASLFQGAAWSLALAAARRNA